MASQKNGFYCLPGKYFTQTTVSPEFNYSRYMAILSKQDYLFIIKTQASTGLIVQLYVMTAVLIILWDLYPIVVLSICMDPIAT